MPKFFKRFADLSYMRFIARKADSRLSRIIKKAKPKNSTGNDILITRIIKKCCPVISPHLTHLINCIRTSSIYPKILKTTLMSPNLKKGKDPYDISSYYPLNNLSTIDKIV